MVEREHGSNSGLATFALIAALAAVLVEVWGFVGPYLAQTDDPAALLRRANLVALGLAAVGAVLGYATRIFPRGQRAFVIGGVMVLISAVLIIFGLGFEVGGAPV